MLTHLRLKHGLLWRGKYPPIPWVHLRRLLVVLAALVLASSLDYYIERAQFAERAAGLFEARAQALSNCEKGATGYYYPDGRAYQCGGKL